MTDVRDRLALAQDERRERLSNFEDSELETMLDAIGVTKEKCVELAIDPKERQQLKGIIARLRRLKHPFTQCMRDLAEHKPEWSDKRRRGTCASLKQAAGRGSGGQSLSIDELGPCVLLTDGMARLLEDADQDVLNQLMSEGDGQPPDVGSGTGAETPENEEVTSGTA